MNSTGDLKSQGDHVLSNRNFDDSDCDIKQANHDSFCLHQRSEYESSLPQINEALETIAFFQLAVVPEIQIQLYDDEMLEGFDRTIDDYLNNEFDNSDFSSLPFPRSYVEVEEGLIQTYNDLSTPERKIMIRNDLESTMPQNFLHKSLLRTFSNAIDPANYIDDLCEITREINQPFQKEGSVTITDNSDSDDPIGFPFVDLRVLNDVDPENIEYQKGDEEVVVIDDAAECTKSYAKTSAIFRKRHNYSDTETESTAGIRRSGRRRRKVVPFDLQR